VVILIFVHSCSMVETNYIMIIDMAGLLVMSTFDGGSLIRLICPTPDMRVEVVL
jgi:hypothetical protein